MFVFPVGHSLSLKIVSVSRTILKNQLQATMELQATMDDAYRMAKSSPRKA
jgi:hypothetical protein